MEGDLKSDMKKVLKVIVLFSFFILQANGCHEDLVADVTLEKSAYYSSEIFLDQYLSIYGKWKIERITGGLSGSGLDPDFDYLFIEKIGIYKIVADKTVTEYGKIVIGKQTETELQIAFLSNEVTGETPPQNYNTLLYKTVTLIDNKLILDDPCCDLFTYQYSRR